MFIVEKSRSLKLEDAIKKDKDLLVTILFIVDLPNGSDINERSEVFFRVV